MPLLGELGLLQRHVGSHEVGAGVLHVLVEETPVELVGQIVVVGDVLARREPLVSLAHALAEPAPKPAPLLLNLELGVGTDEVDELGDLALLQHQAAVHIGLADAESRLGSDPRGPACASNAGDQGGARSVAEAKCTTARQA